MRKSTLYGLLVSFFMVMSSAWAVDHDGPCETPDSGLASVAEALSQNARMLASARLSEGSGADASEAASSSDYQKDLGRYIYSRYPDQVFKGRFPALKVNVVVMSINLDSDGHVTNLSQLRAAANDPTLGASIAKLIHQIEPLPAPKNLADKGIVLTWLVSETGKFQIKGLDEGQDFQQGVRNTPGPAPTKPVKQPARAASTPVKIKP